MRFFPVCPVLCAVLLVSCAEPISLRVTTTPVKGVELTLNRPPAESEVRDAETALTPDSQEPTFLKGKSNCVFTDISQGRDLTIVARKEGYEVAQVTIPAKAEPLGWSLLWSKRTWSSLIWSPFSPHSQYLVWEDADHREVDLEEEGVTIEMKPISSGEHYKASPLPPFDASQMKGW